MNQKKYSSNILLIKTLKVYETIQENLNESFKVEKNVNINIEIKTEQDVLEQNKLDTLNQQFKNVRPSPSTSTSQSLTVDTNACTTNAATFIICLGFFRELGKKVLSLLDVWIENMKSKQQKYK